MYDPFDDDSLINPGFDDLTDSERLEQLQGQGPPRKISRYQDADTVEFEDEPGVNHRLEDYDAYESTRMGLSGHSFAARAKLKKQRNALAAQWNIHPDLINSEDLRLEGLRDKKVLQDMVGEDNEVYSTTSGSGYYGRPLTTIYDKTGKPINDLMNTPKLSAGYYGKYDNVEQFQEEAEIASLTGDRLEPKYEIKDQTIADKALNFAKASAEALPLVPLAKGVAGAFTDRNPADDTHLEAAGKGSSGFALNMATAGTKAFGALTKTIGKASGLDIDYSRVDGYNDYMADLQHQVDISTRYKDSKKWANVAGHIGAFLATSAISTPAMVAASGGEAGAFGAKEHDVAKLEGLDDTSAGIRAAVVSGITFLGSMLGLAKIPGKAAAAKTLSKAIVGGAVRAGVAEGTESVAIDVSRDIITLEDQGLTSKEIGEELIKRIPSYAETAVKQAKIGSVVGGVAGGAVRVKSSEGGLEPAHRPVSSTAGSIDPELKAAVRETDFLINEETRVAARDIEKRMTEAEGKLDHVQMAEWKKLRLEGNESKINDFEVKHKISEPRQIDDVDSTFSPPQIKLTPVEMLKDSDSITKIERFLSREQLKEAKDQAKDLTKYMYNSKLSAAENEALFKKTKEQYQEVYENSVASIALKAATSPAGSFFQRKVIHEFIDPREMSHRISGKTIRAKHVAKRNDPLHTESDFTGKSTVQGAIAHGDLSATDKNRLGLVQDSMTNPGGGTTGLVRAAEQTGRAAVLANFTSTVRQFGDIAYSIYRNGLGNTLGAMDDIVRKKSHVLTKEEIGIDPQVLLKELGSNKPGFIDNIYKMSGMIKADSLGKNTFINADIRNVKKLLVSRPEVVRKRVGGIFKDKKIVDQVMDDLLKSDPKKYSIQTRFILNNKLMDFSPAGRSEFAADFNKAGNEKIAMMFQSFYFKHLDIIRSESLSKIASGDPKKVREGSLNLFKLALPFIAANTGIDVIQSFMDGDTSPEVMEAIKVSSAGFLGVGEHAYYSDDKLGSMVSSKVNAPFATSKALIKDLNTKGKYGYKSIERIPVVGKIYSSHAPGGYKRQLREHFKR